MNRDMDFNQHIIIYQTSNKVVWMGSGSSQLFINWYLTFVLKCYAFWWMNNYQGIKNEADLCDSRRSDHSPQRWRHSVSSFLCFDSSFPEGGEVTFHCTILSHFASSEYMSMCLSQHGHNTCLLWFPFGLQVLYFCTWICWLPVSWKLYHFMPFSFWCQKNFYGLLAKS